jgi:hypothetical protein
MGKRSRDSTRRVPAELATVVSGMLGATLSNLNATTFDDFVSYLPGVRSHGVDPAAR